MEEDMEKESAKTVIEKMRSVKEKFEAYSKIEMSERQIRAEIANIPWIGTMIDNNINAGIFPSEDLAKIEQFLSSLQAIKLQIDSACDVLGKTPVNNLEFDYYPRLVETIDEFKEMVANIQVLLAEGTLWAS